MATSGRPPDCVQKEQRVAALRCPGDCAADETGSRWHACRLRRGLRASAPEGVVARCRAGVAGRRALCSLCITRLGGILLTGQRGGDSSIDAHVRPIVDNPRITLRLRECRNLLPAASPDFASSLKSTPIASTLSFSHQEPCLQSPRARACSLTNGIAGVRVEEIEPPAQ